jgi:hypothetical protein
MGMNGNLIGHLFRLRYKLLWARTRTRNGKIALFVVGYFLFFLLLTFILLGGIGAGIVAVRSGKALWVAQGVLTAVFFQSLITALTMGFGMNAIFSDAELRRYPIAERERWLARHLVAIVDPFWILSIVLELGLLVGLSLLDAASFGMGAVAVLLLFATNYLAARVLGLLLERLMQHKIGSLVLLMLILAVSFGVGTMGQWLAHVPGAGKALGMIFSCTPPFGAASVMTSAGFHVVSGLALLVCWLAGLIFALTVLERRAPSFRSESKKISISWRSIYDRLADLFGSENAPLTGYWLRFYLRNSRFRTMYVISLPVAAFLTFSLGSFSPGGHSDPVHIFVVALGTFPMVTFLGPGKFVLNQFGYSGGGFRRFFLLPADPAAALRTGSYASILLSASLLIPAAAVWIVFEPLRFDVRLLCMLVASGIAGLMGIHGIGLWATMFGPRRGNYNQALGNDLSAMGNTVLVGGMLILMFLPQSLAKAYPSLTQPEQWWLAIPLVVASSAFYVFSLRSACALFPKRREQLMAVVEGRQS